MILLVMDAIGFDDGFVKISTSALCAMSDIVHFPLKKLNECVARDI